MRDFQSSPEGLRIEDFQSFDEGFGFWDFLDWIEDFFQPLDALILPGNHGELLDHEKEPRNPHPHYALSHYSHDQ